LRTCVEKFYAAKVSGYSEFTNTEADKMNRAKVVEEVLVDPPPE
jgi:hypothetical protein